MPLPFTSTLPETKLRCSGITSTTSTFFQGPEAVEAFAQQLEGYETSKGTIRLPLDRPLPLETIAELGRWCLRAYGK